MFFFSWFLSLATHDQQYNAYEQTESERLSFLLKVTQLSVTSGIWTPYDSTVSHKYKFIKYKLYMQVWAMQRIVEDTCFFSLL